MMNKGRSVEAICYAELLQRQQVVYIRLWRERGCRKPVEEG